MNAVTSWIETHPTIFALIVWPILTAILTSVFAKPSDAFAAKYPRLAAIRRIPSDAGINLPKLFGNVLTAITGKAPPSVDVKPVFPDEQPTKKEGRSIPPLPVLFFMLALALVATGCNGAKAPTARDSSRAAIELLATALPLANELCSKSTDRSTLEACAKAYDVGRPSLIAAAQVVDVWAGASANDRACVLSSSLKAVSSIVAAMRGGGLAVPDLVVDALSFAGALVGSCKEVAP